jgi:hypothetical protein
MNMLIVSIFSQISSTRAPESALHLRHLPLADPLPRPLFPPPGSPGSLTRPFCPAPPWSPRSNPRPHCPAAPRGPRSYLRPLCPAAPPKSLKLNELDRSALQIAENDDLMQRLAFPLFVFVSILSVDPPYCIINHWVFHFCNYST